MRPKMSPILQQNNNNNYPYLSGAGLGADPLPLKCSLPLPFSSRPDLSLTGLPLIRGLRAWALCSRSRHRLGGPLGPAPLSHPRPADVHLSAEWGLPLGLNARQAGMGALVTLQTSEGSSRTQTQCLFLRTDRGSCLYPTTKPTLHTTPQQPGIMLRDWLKSKTGAAPALSSHSEASRARDRLGRRWRKPANHTVSRERAHSRHYQHKSRVTTGPELEHPQAQPRKEPREETGDQPREEIREETWEETRDQTKDETRDESRDQYREETKEESREATRDLPNSQSKDKLRDENVENSREDTSDLLKEKTREQHRDGTVEHREVSQMDLKHQDHLIHMIKPKAGSVVRVQIEELQSYSCTSRKHVSPNAEDTIVMRFLCGPSHGVGCVLPFSPAEGSSFKAKNEEADPLVFSWGTLGETEQRSSGVLDRVDIIINKASPRGQSPDPQRDQPSLDTRREPPQEDQEFGGFMQAPSVSSYDCFPWSDSGPAETCHSSDQTDSSWTAFPLHGTKHTVDEGGQWWPLSSVEDMGPTSGASQSQGYVFTAAFPLPPACSTSCPWDSPVPTLTQLLRVRKNPEEGFPDQGLLDKFHDLNKMIVQGYKQASGVSQELLQRSLSLAPPGTKSGVGPGNWRICHGHASSSHLALL